MINESNLREVEKEKNQLEIDLKNLLEEKEKLVKQKQEQEDKQNHLTNELKINEEKIEAINNLKNLVEEKPKIEKQKQEQGHSNIRFEETIKDFKKQKIEAEDKKESNLKQVKKIKNTVWKRFLIRFTCGWYNPIAKLEKENKNLTLEIKNFDSSIESYNKKATKLASEYMELESKIELIEKDINLNQEKLKKWNLTSEEKEKLEGNVISLKNDLKTIQNQVEETNKQLNPKLQIEKDLIEKYTKVVEKLVEKKEENSVNKTCIIGWETEKKLKDCGIDIGLEPTDDIAFNCKTLIGSNNPENNKSDSKVSTPQIVNTNATI